MTPPQSVLRSPGPPHGTPCASPAVLADLQDDVQLLEIPPENILTLEYGRNFQSKRTISEQLLCRHSALVLSYREDAQKLGKKYKSCEDITRKLASLSVMMTPKKYTEDGAQAQIMKLLERIRDHYPLEKYQPRIQQVLSNTVEDQFILRNVKSQCNVKANSKGYRDMVLMSRLSMLNHEGMQIICDRLIGLFTRIEALQKAAAETDNISAHAQGRLRLAGTSEQTVQSLVAWLEHGRLHFETQSQLFNLYNLATKLRIDALSEECLDQLFDMTSTIIQEAYADGSSLQQLLGYGEPDRHDQASANYEPPDSAVKAMFERVLTSEQPSAKLSEMVSVLLAKYMDAELWEYLRPSIKHPFALQVIGAMVARAEIKADTEFDDGAPIKRENHDEVTEIQLNAPESRQ